MSLELPTLAQAPSMKINYIVPKNILTQLISSSHSMQAIKSSPLQWLSSQLERTHLPPSLASFSASLTSLLSSSQAIALDQLLFPEPTKHSSSTFTNDSHIETSSVDTDASSQSVSPAEENILLSLPPDKKEKGRTILHIISSDLGTRISYNARGNFVDNGIALAGTNFADLLSFLLRRDPVGHKSGSELDDYWKGKSPAGIQNFFLALASSSLPLSLISNSWARGKIEALRLGNVDSGDAALSRLRGSAPSAPSASSISKPVRKRPLPSSSYADHIRRFYI